MEEEEEIKQKYKLEKEEPRKVSVKTIKVKAGGSRRVVDEAAEEASMDEEEVYDEDVPEMIEEQAEDAYEDEELLEALQQALNTEDEAEAESEKPVELKKVMIFTIPLTTQSNVVELAVKELIL